MSGQHHMLCLHSQTHTCIHINTARILFYFFSVSISNSHSTKLHVIPFSCITGTFQSQSDTLKHLFVSHWQSYSSVNHVCRSNTSVCDRTGPEENVVSKRNCSLSVKDIYENPCHLCDFLLVSSNCVYGPFNGSTDVLSIKESFIGLQVYILLTMLYNVSHLWVWGAKLCTRILKDCYSQGTLQTFQLYLYYNRWHYGNWGYRL